MKSTINDQCAIPATYMRGGTSKGVFFRLCDLPKEAQVAGEYRDRLLRRVIGSPDHYGKQIDGMGGATSSTSKVVIISKSNSVDHDIDYLFGQVSINEPLVDWSGNCGNLSAAVGPFALHSGLISKERIPLNGVVKVRVWQANINKTIVVHVPVVDRHVQESGNFQLDGVTFPSAEIPIDFMSPTVNESGIFPTGHIVDELIVSNVGHFNATFISSGIPTIFIEASAVGYEGTELQDDINRDESALEKLELIRAYGAIKMGLISSLEEAQVRQHTPKLVLVSKPKAYRSSCGKWFEKHEINFNARALSMGKLHHAMMGTAAVAIASAARVPGTIVHQVFNGDHQGPITFGHPSGSLTVGAEVIQKGDKWVVEKVTMSRSARRLMEGVVFIPRGL
ncbi:2-methylaconitate cis-trans isomerase PrpF [Vibrio sagamiensis]|uniref:Putative methylaconitate Delta-isomerase PrpF n=1 Tax=Vibrio sagamiensis NBRC 104589 TaxID=1219064 RepID=A0A511QDT4_9VIBR|nr:2-methylaconitate cis-trans isomerase PrpF [Vibrio sagamiensis]PNQ56188.1 2-methylaconitate cis-trans isomerase PrpF [Vibrio agarivorans]GEM75475.1 putative methylaconitate Delta-isomerase PrpF [Vibrio sagamiensis NBRC 104589]